MTLGFLPLCLKAAGIWPHLVGQPSIGGTPTDVPHGGRNSYRRGVWRRMYISRNFCFLYLFFENQRKNIKKFLTPYHRTSLIINWQWWPVSGTGVLSLTLVARSNPQL
jgi:hypothetical protein